MGIESRGVGVRLQTQTVGLSPVYGVLLSGVGELGGGLGGASSFPSVEPYAPSTAL